MNPISSFALVGATLLGASLVSQQPAKPQLLADINQTSRYGLSSYITSQTAQHDGFWRQARFAKLGSHLFFQAREASSGRELYYCSKALGSAKLAADINKGVGDSLPANFLTLGGKLYFVATDGINSYQIFESSIASGGVTTRRITSLAGTSAASSIGTPIAFGSYLYFTAYVSASSSYQIHRLDPVTASIQLVTAQMKYHWSKPVDMGSHVIFEGSDSKGTEAWWMDGTRAGVLTDYIGGNGYCTHPFVLNKKVYFAAFNGAWKIFEWDGKVAVKTLAPLPLNNQWSYPVALGSKIVFGGGNGHPYAIDTAAVQPVAKFLLTSTLEHSFRAPVVMAGKVYYSGYSSKQSYAGDYLFESDGVTAKSIPGTRKYQGSGGVWYYPEVMNGPSPYILCRYKDSSFGNSIYKFDGSNLVRLVRIHKSSYSGGYPSFITELGGEVLFSATDGSFGSELWRSDGSTSGTMLHTNIAIETRNNSSNPRDFCVVDRKVYFAANDGIHGIELWETDGKGGNDSGSGTKMVKDLNPGSGSSNPTGLEYVGGVVLFLADSGTGIFDLVRLDPSALKNIFPVGGLATVSKTEWGKRQVLEGGAVITMASDTIHGSEPHTYNADTNKLELIADTNPGVGSGAFRNATLHFGEWWFEGPLSSGGGHPLWRSGKPGTKARVESLPNNTELTGGLTTYGDDLLMFEGKNKSGKVSACTYNPKTKAFLEFFNVTATYDRAFVDSFEVGGKMYFTAITAGLEHLYETDGTAANTKKAIATPIYGLNSFSNTLTQQESVAIDFGLDGDKVFFPGFLGGSQIWKATSTGLSRMGTTVLNSVENAIALGRERVAFIANTATSGTEVFVLSPSILDNVSDSLAPGMASSTYRDGGLWAMDGALFFSGTGPNLLGAEPYKVDVGSLSQPYGNQGLENARLWAADPIPGTTLALGFELAMTSNTGLAFLSTPLPIPFPFLEGRVYINPVFFAMLTVALNQGSGILNIPIPNHPNLPGFAIELQGITVPATSSLLPRLTNALNLHFGG